METEPRPKIGMGVAIFKDGKVLMAVRKAAHGSGTYQFPGGHMEHMESFEDCARRETREEAGIEIQNVRFQFIANVKTFAPKHYVHIGMTADWASGEPQQMEPEKSGPWEWYDMDKIPQPQLVFAQMHFRALKDGTTFFDNVT
jgi:8-oxo-dGTP diphosphatase